MYCLGEKMKTMKKKHVSCILGAALLAMVIIFIVEFETRHEAQTVEFNVARREVLTLARDNYNAPPHDNYTLALHKALMFFNAQRSGKLPQNNNVTWRGNSCDATKFNFPASFSMTMLSWSVIEYSAKYEKAGELQHVHDIFDIIKWGSDYLLKTFNHTADSSTLVGKGEISGGSTEENDHYCWMRPEDIKYDRPVTSCSRCSDLAAEMAAALASASIVFKDNKSYSEKLVHGARTLFKFSRDQRGRYSAGNEASIFYNSTGYWDEFISFLATLFSDYLEAADTPGWYCGPNFYSTDMNYILGKNPRKMGYLVGYGNHYPKQVHHRGASIPKDKTRYSCKGGWKWRDSKKPNPNTVVGAIVAGPDKNDGFHDIRTNYNYTKPTLAGNAGLVAALVALSGDGRTGIDKNTMFSAVPPMFPTPPPPPMV
ncbi:hypothetical protein LIER_30265 [Lithospermum erythrorhizon]|uniref:cellulase n=1 Tax=Lithospermum erythrorhizon TaxID=34254 RepID=A0AAV3RQ50_LITER